MPPPRAPSGVEPRAGLPSGGLLGERYEVVRELGRGGMGVVYACFDRATGVKVALKRVDRPGRPVNAGETFWFHQEARALASLDHPAIVRGRDFGVLEDGSPYLVMELIAGRSLWSLMELGPVAWPLTWAILDQSLAALAHAHARGVIHGDLKPQNILVEGVSDGRDPRVHVLDFGLAFLLRDRHDPRLDGASPAQVALPSGGGTPGFMAPEQIRRAMPHVGPPTDLYALGCILFQLLDGRPPFIAMREGPNGTEYDEEKLLQLHKRAPVPKPNLPPGAPPEVAEIVVRMLAKRPWRRFDFAGEVRDRWERLRPTISPADLAREGEDDDDIELESVASAPDTRIDVLTVAGINPAAPVTPPKGAPELLGLRPPPLVGRHHERAELRRMVDLLTAESGPRARMVLLEGEAGVGKSRIAEWICERVHEQAKMIPLRARYRRINSPQDGLNGAVLAHYGLERVDRILVEQALINVWEVDKDDDDGLTWVAATAEWLRPSSYGKDREDPAEGKSDRRTRGRPQVGPTGKRFTLDEPELRWLVIRRVLERIGRERPLLLWLDDIHNAPPTTLEGLVKILREVPTLRMLVVATARREALGDRVVDRRIESMRRALGGPRLVFGPLEAADTHALLRASLPLDDRALHEAQARSKGNPLFALQLLHAWAATGGLELVGDHYRVKSEALVRRATTTGELWDERLEALDPRHRAAAEAASALGHEYRGDVLRRLVGHVVGLGGFGVDVARAIDALERAHILVATGEDRFRFPHALLQEHLLHRLASREDAPKVFRAAAEALAHHPLAGTRRIVRHRVLNLLRAGDGDAAAEVLIDYVDEAWARVRDASRTLEDLALLDVRPLDVSARVLGSADASGGHVAVIAPPAIAPLWSAKHARWRAEALRHAGRFDEARTAAQKARKIFVGLGEEREEAHVQRLLGHIASELGEQIEGRKSVARALAAFDRLDDDRGRATCEVVLGEIDFLLGDYVSARDVLHRGARRFRTIVDPLGRAQCLLLLGMIEQAEGQLARARDLLTEARTEFDGIGYRLGISQCDVALAHVDHRAGDHDAARSRAHATRRALRSLENPRGLAAVERLLAMLAIDEDDATSAGRHAREAFDLYAKLGDPWGILESRLLLAQESILRSAIEGATVELEACEKIEVVEAEPQQHRHLVRAWLAAEQRAWERAARALDDAQAVFHDPRRMGDYAAQLLFRFRDLDWEEPAGTKVREWSDAVLSARPSSSGLGRAESYEPDLASLASADAVQAEPRPFETQGRDREPGARRDRGSR
jgi:serine/threonine protein kinase/tetratricopeptide (TPR) repeat protein